MFRWHFTGDRYLSCAFPARWPLRSPDLIPCSFWLLGYLKNKVYQGNIGNLTGLKNQILLHVYNFGSDQFHPIVDHFITLCYILVLKQGEHIENL